jgi:hypothetical protein
VAICIILCVTAVSFYVKPATQQMLAQVAVDLLGALFILLKLALIIFL